MQKRKRPDLQCPIKIDTDDICKVPRRYVNFYPLDILFKITSVSNSDFNIRCISSLSQEDCRNIQDTYIYEALIRNQLYQKINNDQVLIDMNNGKLCIGENIKPHIVEVDLTSDTLEVFDNYSIKIDDRFKLMLNNNKYVLIQRFKSSPDHVTALVSQSVDVEKIVNIIKHLYDNYQFVHWDLHKNNYLINKTTGDLEIIDFDMSWIGKIQTPRSISVYRDSLAAFKELFGNYSNSTLGHFLDIGNVIKNNNTNLINKLKIQYDFVKLIIPDKANNKYFKYNIELMFFGMKYYEANGIPLSNSTDENIPINNIQEEIEETQIIDTNSM